MSKDTTIINVAFATIGFLLGVGLGIGLCTDYHRKRAVEMGVAEYYMPEPTSQHTEFRWKPVPEESKP